MLQHLVIKTFAAPAAFRGVSGRSVFFHSSRSNSSWPFKADSPAGVPQPEVPFCFPPFSGLQPSFPGWSSNKRKKKKNESNHYWRSGAVPAPDRTFPQHVSWLVLPAVSFLALFVVVGFSSSVPLSSRGSSLLAPQGWRLLLRCPGVTSSLLASGVHLVCSLALAAGQK